MVSYQYDTGSGSCTQGHLIQVSNSSSTTNLTGYDCLGRVTASNQVLGDHPKPATDGHLKTGH